METKKQGILGLRRKKFAFSRAQKHLIVQEYLTGILSKREIWEKYTGEKQKHRSPTNPFVWYNFTAPA